MAKTANISPKPQTSASLRWKFPICSTGFSLPSKLDGCLESYSLSSWNELDEMPLFVPPHFFIRAERMTLRSTTLALHCVVLHSYAPVPLSVLCTPCSTAPLIPRLHLRLKNIRWAGTIATQSPLLGKTSLSFYGTRADVKEEGKSLFSQNLNRFGTDSEVLPIGRHIKPSLCNVDLIVLAFVSAFECFSLPEVFIFVWMRRLWLSFSQGGDFKSVCRPSLNKG